MPSVFVLWKGNCRDAEGRYRLLSYLHLLAKLNDDYLRDRQPERPAFLRIVNEERRAGKLPRPNIEIIDQEVEGDILVSSSVSAHPGTLITRAREAGLAVMEDEDERRAFIALDRARLRGINFKLFDPRGLYPNADRMSFVFLECPEYHFLDGRIVDIEVGEGEAGVMEALAAKPVRLVMPAVHLRYYLEDWTDCLFSWMRFFFIGDLCWERWEELQGYEDYRGLFGDLQTERGTEAAEAASFEAILSTFSEHAEHWIGEVEGMAEAEKA